MKKIIVAITFLILTTTLSAQSGIMWGETKIKYVSTKYFDIIYEPDSADSAALLRENADRILEEVQDFFGAGEIRMRVPVVISANCERFNALCASIPYPIINIYDTAIDESMTVFTDDFLSTFKHELTHAYTLNLKNDRINKITRIFGNLYNPAFITVSSGIAESATLTSESSTGEGRLNDEWSKQITRQAKIENKWPKFWDEQGISTKYYAGDYYYFNGEFAKYLQETYGMEKYAAFWYTCVNIKTPSGEKPNLFSDAFWTVYRTQIKTAWEDFRKSLFVPEYSEPFETDGVKDFFTKSNEKYSLENNRGAIYQNLLATEDGLYYLDYKSANVYFVSNEKLNSADGKKIAPKKIFHKSGISKIAASSDGRFIAYDYYSSNSANYKCCVGVYDTKTKLHLKAGDSLKTPSIIKQGDDYYLLALNFISQKKQIAIKKIIVENNRLKKFGESKFIPLAEGINILSTSDIGNGKIAMILKSGMNWELCLADTNSIIQADDDAFTKITLPEEKMTMRYLSYSPDDNSIYFSWTKPDSMPRLGKFSLDKNEFVLSDKNISGGVYYPVVLENKIYYTGKFTKQNRIFSCENLFGETYTADIESKDFSEIPNDVITLQKPTEEILSDAKRYNPLKSYLHPLVIPASLNSSYSFDVRSEDFGDKTSLPFLGVTLIGLNPWLQGQTQISLGYGLETNSFAISGSFQSGTDTSLFSYSISSQAEFDSTGFKQALASGSINFNLDWISFADSAQLLIGQSNTRSLLNAFDALNSLSLLDSLNLITVLNTLNANSKKDTPFPNDKLLYVQNSFDIAIGKRTVYESELLNTIGAVWTVSLINVFEKTISSDKPFEYNTMNVGTSFVFYIPRLLPINCYDRFVYNLPSKISLGAYTETTEVFFGTAKSTIFGYDIQKGIPYLFFRKIFIDVGYSFAFSYEDYKAAGNFEILNIKNHFNSISKGELPYSDMIFIDVNTELAPNIGMLSIPFTLTLGFGYSPNPHPTTKKFNLRFDIEFSL